MVEPRRQCYSLPSINLRKKVVGGILFVTVILASTLTGSNMKGSPFGRQGSSLMDATLEENNENKLTRRTYASPGSSPRWDMTFNMVLHGDIGSLKFHLYKSSPICVKYDFLTSSEIKLKYVDDDSTIFWAVGHGSNVLVKHAERIGEEVEMIVPFEGFNFGEGKWAASDMNVELQRRKRWINELSHFLSIMLNSINNYLKNCSSSRKVIETFCKEDSNHRVHN
ncbi:hypothetical protein AAG906_017995 [Vitis piasezkii]